MPLFVDLEADEPQDGHISRALTVLASPARLALLRQLRTPRTLAEIRVRGENDETRSISRQAIRDHLDRLLELNLVFVRETHRSYGATVEYSLNHQALYAVSEQVRLLARLRPEQEPVGDTVGRPPPATPRQRNEARLILVKGIDEGRAFSLAPGSTERWIIGRRRGLAISLDFDPFVSSENAEITFEGGSYLLRDLADSRNGTQLNFAPLAKGARARLREGDILGVGHSLLVFRLPSTT